MFLWVDIVKLIFNKRISIIGLRKDIVHITINDFKLLRDSEAYKF